MLAYVIHIERFMTAHAEPIQWRHHEQFIELLYSTIIIIAAQNVLLVNSMNFCCNGWLVE